MEQLKELQQINPWVIIGALIIILLFWSFIQELLEKTIGKLVSKFGIKLETKVTRQRREDHELLIKVSENLVKLQERHESDEEEFRNNLNNYMEESRKDRKALHDEMKQYAINRVNDRQVSIEREQKLNDRITETNKQTTEIIGDVNKSLSKLTDMIVDSNIENMRWEILNFCSALTSGRKYNKESFNHVISVHEKYEKILEENNMENGQVTASMEVIMDVYKEKLKNGF